MKTALFKALLVVTTLLGSTVMTATALANDNPTDCYALAIANGDIDGCEFELVLVDSLDEFSDDLKYEGQIVGDDGTYEALCARDVLNFEARCILGDLIVGEINQIPECSGEWVFDSDGYVVCRVEIPDEIGDPVVVECTDPICFTG